MNATALKIVEATQQRDKDMIETKADVNKWMAEQIEKNDKKREEARERADFLLKHQAIE